MPASRHVLLFVALAFGLSWSLVGVFKAAGGTPAGGGFMMLALAYMAMPAVAAVLVQLRRPGESIPAALGFVWRPNAWLLVAWILPVVISLAAMFLGPLLSDVRLSFDPALHFERMMPLVEKTLATMPAAEAEKARAQLPAMKEQMSQTSPALFFLTQLTQMLVAGLTLNAVVALGEELGWRGFLQRALAPLGFWTASLVTGVVWGLWHAPLIAMGHNYPDHPIPGIAMMVAFCVLYSPVISYVRLRSRSVLAAAIFHGSLNASGGFALLYSIGGDDLTRGLTGLPGFVALAAVNVVLIVRKAPGANEALAELASGVPKAT